MRGFCVSLLAVTALALPAGAQTVSSQSSMSSNTRVSAAAGQSSAPARSDSSTNASRQAQASRSKSGQREAESSASASNSTSASASAGPASLELSNGTVVHANLLTTLDARKSKPGQRVVARTTQDVKQDGHVVLRKGTRLVGHVSQVQARSKNSAESSVGIVFDYAEMKHGQQAPIHLAIQALAAAQSETSAALDNNDLMGSGSLAGSGAASGGAAGGGGLLGGVGSTVGGAVGGAGSVAGNAGQTVGGTVGAAANTMGSAAGSASGLDAAGQLTSTGSGVVGLPGLALNSQLASATEGSVVTSSARNIHLSSGTQMLLRVVAQ